MMILDEAAHNKDGKGLWQGWNFGHRADL